ncbi:MAG TPA: LamG-like jellyroll fold domain-containing protein [Acidimicrobiales bacterium]|nr:LamG-like jellyroll fold domain-containing protein [Acidimicrobiales bacterium]
MNRSRRGGVALLIAGLLAPTLAGIPLAGPAAAGIHRAGSEVTYKEYWVPHSQFTAGCPEHGEEKPAGNVFYFEPGPCAKSVNLEIPDNAANALKAEIYIDLWRNHDDRSARFQVNGGVVRTPNVGSDWSRTPYVGDIPLTELRQGTNTFTFTANSGRYHVHDIAVRIYHDATRPLVAGSGSDVVPPDAKLTKITAGGVAFDPAVGGTLAVDDDKIRFDATASGAAYVEFHAFYDGFDEDANGVTADWHSFNRNNWNPGGLSAKATGGTIGHPGTATGTAPTVTWSLPHVPNQAGVKFKVRAVDAAGNVREAAGGVSADFTLARSQAVEVFRVTGFEDAGIYQGGTQPDVVHRTIDLPSNLDPASVSSALLVGTFWQNPFISVNNNTAFTAFAGTEDVWNLSLRSLTPSELRPGANTLSYSHNPLQSKFGHFVERPGPMLLLRRTAPSGPPAIITEPTDATVEEGQIGTFSAAATGTEPLAYQWQRNGIAIGGATSSSYTTPPVTPADHGANYRVVVTNSAGTATSRDAQLSVLPTSAGDAPWFDTRWDYRVPISVGAGGHARTDKPVDLILNFTDLMRATDGGAGTFDPGSIRVVEVDGAGVVIDNDVPTQFDPSSNYNATTMARGNLVFLAEGPLAANGVRRFHVYFDKTGKSFTPPPVTPRVTLTEGATDQGQAAYRIATSQGEWYYHTSGGGFSSLNDANGNDWINWSTSSGSAGDFRGIPNLVPPAQGGYFHPGRTTSSTILLNKGPLKATFQSTSSDGLWRVIWEVYPTYATMVTVRLNGEHWFLYEGTPGGTLDTTNDTVTRSNGTTTSLGSSWTGDLVGDEWAYFSDVALNRSLFAANHTDDGAVDSYRQQNGQMTVFGFGRLDLTPYLRGVGRRYTVGLLDSTAVGATGAAVRAAYKDLAVAVGAAKFNGVFEGPFSDDFFGTTLDPRWRFVDPRGDVQLSLTGTNARVAVPAGQTHDLWTGRNFAPRLLQPVTNVGFEVEAKYESLPDAAFQSQGIVAQQDLNNLVRADVTHNGTSTRIFAASMVSGTATTRISTTIAGTNPIWLRLSRSGDTWTVRWSSNGTTFTNMGSFSHALTLTEVGPFVANHGTTSSNAPAFTGSLDYFWNTGLANPPDDARPPTPTDVVATPSGRGAVVTWATAVPADSKVDYGRTTSLGSVASAAALVTSHRIELFGLLCNTTYVYKVTSTNADGTRSSPLATFVTGVCPVIASDDFSSTTLHSRWSFVNPVGDATLSLTGTNAVISVPAGVNHDLWAGANRAPRLVQEGPVGDFEVEAKFESAVTQRFQVQGIVVEQGLDDFLRVDVHHDGTGWVAFAGRVAAGRGTTLASQRISALSATHQRLKRTGDTWTYSISGDGVTFSEVGSFNTAIDAGRLGPFVATVNETASLTPAFTSSVDFFFNTASPIVPEDGGAAGDTRPPVLSDVSATAGAQTATVTWATDEPASSRVEFGATTSYGATASSVTLVQSHRLDLVNLVCGRTYHFRAQSTDAAGNTGSSPDNTFQTAACQGGPVSDDFSSGVIDPNVWTFVNPVGDAALSTINRAARISLPSGVSHNITSSTDNRAPRLLQAFPNTDFSVEVKFDSPVTKRSQIQGLIFEQDGANLVRFDASHNGTATQLFVGRLASGSLATRKQTSVPLTAPMWLRAARAGTNWSFSYSTDGSTFTDFHTMSETIDIHRLGFFAGNHHPTTSSIPAFAAQADYFFNTASPIVPEDGGAADATTNIDAWYGLQQVFGKLGQPQRWVNVLGRITDPNGISAVAWSLAGGAFQALTLGADLRRLAEPGDFVIEIDRATLVAGLNKVLIRVVNALGSTVDQLIDVDYTPDTVWPLPYNIDWSTVTSVADVAQVVDGKWRVENGALRTTQIGYDRLVAIGDVTWRDYEATVPITINSVDTATGFRSPSNGPGIGVILRWTGHIAEDSSQPRWGFKRALGAIAWYRYRTDTLGDRLQLTDENGAVAADDTSGLKLTPGVRYMFKARAETIDVGQEYKLKVWRADQAEPGTWNLQTRQALTDPDAGSLLLVAHHVDASFGNVSVSALPTEAPQITPASGTYEGSVPISMSSSTAGATIRYTTDGTNPTNTSTVYTGPFSISASATIKAQAFRAGRDPSTVSSATYTITAATRRSTGLAALYEFEEGTGTTVADTSGVGTALPLTVANGSAVRWVDGGLILESPTSITSAAAASKISSPAKTAKAVTVEGWVGPANLTQTGPAQIAAISKDSSNRNVALGQAATAWDGRVRTSATAAAGAATTTPNGSATTNLRHVVFVRESGGATRLYVDGVLSASGSAGGDLSTWDTSSYRLILGNEFGGARPWLGEFQLVAFYSRALSATDVSANYGAGPSNKGLVNRAPNVSAGADQEILTTEAASLDGTVSDDGRPNPPGTTSSAWTVVTGPGTVTFASASSTDTTATFSAAGTYVLRLTAGDGALSASDDVTVTVVTADTPVATPTIDPSGGTHAGSVTVSLATVTPGSTIRYTTDGTDPTSTSTAYSAPFVLGTAGVTTVKARAFKSGRPDSAIASAVFTITEPPRVTDGLRALYEFNEGTGSTVTDTSGVGTALNLTVQDPSRTTWTAGGLRVDSATEITSTGSAKISDAVRSSNAVTLEAWITPANTSQTGPARIAGISVDLSNRNVMLGQATSAYSSRVRTTTLGSNGTPTVQTASGAVTTALQHVVVTRDTAGSSRIYVDGTLRQTGSAGGDLSTWNSTYPVVLARELTDNYPWLGTFHLIAFYAKALSGTEIEQNFTAGPDGTAGGPATNAAPTVSAGADQEIVLPNAASLDGTVTDDGLPNPPGVTTVAWTTVSGPGTVTFASASSTDTTASFSAAGTYVLRLSASDGTLSASDDVTVTVIAADTPVATPTIDPNGGTHAGSVTVSLATTTTGATIRYTTDGTDPTSTSTAYSAPFTLGEGSHTVKARAFKSGRPDSAIASAVFTVTASPRVTTGLAALYEFNEGTGSTVTDTSGVGTPLDLAVADPANVSWITGGLRVNSSTIISSAAGAAKVSDAVKAANAVTVEAWIKPANTTQTGPARIATISADTLNRNVTLGQAASAYDGRVRTTTLGVNGSPSTQTASGAATTALQHVVMARDSAGTIRIYVGGALVQSGTAGGTLGNWDSTYRLALADEIGGSRPWLGEYHLVAFYAKALSAAEVSQNLTAGPGAASTATSTTNAAPSVSAGPDQTVVLPASANLDGTVTDDGLPNPPGATTTAWTKVSGPGTVTFGSASATDTTASFSAAGTYVLRLTADDGALSASDDVTVVVSTSTANAAPTVSAGPDQTIVLPSSATLDGTVTDDGLPNPPAATTTAWTKVSGPGTVTFGSASATDTTASFSAAGTYVLRLTANDGALSASDDVTVVVSTSSTTPSRLANGVQALYTFEAGSGSTVADVSGVGTPLDLTIADPSKVSWLPGGGLAVNSSTMIKSAAPAAKITDALKASNALTVEAWVKPANTTQDGPARIASISAGTLNRNVTLGQSASAWNIRLRTSSADSDANGRPATVTPTGTATTALHHVVYTRDAAGNVNVYVDGVLRASGTVGGNLSNWDSAYQLVLANETTGDRPFLGELHLVAFWNRALAASEVQQNFSAGV